MSGGITVEQAAEALKVMATYPLGPRAPRPRPAGLAHWYDGSLSKWRWAPDEAREREHLEFLSRGPTPLYGLNGDMVAMGGSSPGDELELAKQAEAQERHDEEEAMRRHIKRQVRDFHERLQLEGGDEDDALEPMREVRKPSSQKTSWLKIRQGPTHFTTKRNIHRTLCTTS